jgi:hypothetical protein
MAVSSQKMIRGKTARPNITLEVNTNEMEKHCLQLRATVIEELIEELIEFGHFQLIVHAA